MKKPNLDQIKDLRSQTGAGVMDCRRALQDSEGDNEKAKKWLRQKGFQRAGKRAGRETSQGFIETYSHADGKIVSLVELLCETDFVARTEDFRRTAHEIALQMAAMFPQNKDELLKQPYIRDASQTIQDLMSDLAGKTGENVRIGRLARWQIGD
ncbi:MAG: translation elongation factor Ts [Candidatus Shapirobacteria bacterium]